MNYAAKLRALIRKLETKARKAKLAYTDALDRIYELDEVAGDRVRLQLENFPHG